MARRRVLLLLKPFDVYPPRPYAGAFSPALPPPPRATNPKIVRYLDDRCKVHKETVNLCKNILQRRPLDWLPVLRHHLSHPIHDVELVITVGGDGTLLQVDEFIDEFDATRSTGYLCAATARNFEQILDTILDGNRCPLELSRISVKLNGLQLPTYALNDILVSHSCPATASRFSFRTRSNSGESSHLIGCRSSGLRVSTGGGFVMPISSHELQYMIREPISPRAADKLLMHGLVKLGQSMLVVWYNQEGAVYIDGSHVFYSIEHGDTLEISSDAPNLKVILPEYVLKQAFS